jgi:hypothetical protein
MDGVLEDLVCFSQAAQARNMPTRFFFHRIDVSEAHLNWPSVNKWLLQQIQICFSWTAQVLNLPKTVFSSETHFEASLMAEAHLDLSQRISARRQLQQNQNPFIMEQVQNLAMTAGFFAIRHMP